jgi:dihydrolipoamide dehydrogenase
MSKQFDVIVVGAGPGGYIAAIRAAQLGFSVACIEKWQTSKGSAVLGGTCLNVGCIPSKALLASSEAFENVVHDFPAHGIEVKNAHIDLAKMQARKQQIVDKMTKGIEYLFRKNKITWLKGQGTFSAVNQEKKKEQREAGYVLDIVSAGQVQTVSGRHVIIATGSKARHLPDVPVDQRLVVDNEGALSFDTVPKTLAVIGAGVIGLELGSVWRRLGANVTILEGSPHFLAAADEAVAKEAATLFDKQGLAIHLGVKISTIEKQKNKVSIAYTDQAGDAKTLIADRLIVAIGRLPNTDGLGLENIGLQVDLHGLIEVDDECQTILPNLYAIGDVVRGPMLAHKAEDEGVMVAERIAGQKPHIDYNCIPSVIYTAPEIAWVGQTEQQLRQAGRAYKAGHFPFAANGRALGIGHAEGFVKILADAKTDEILGVHIISSGASDLIAEATVALEFKAASEDIARICHPHPSLSEVMREAALAVDQRALNL